MEDKDKTLHAILHYQRNLNRYVEKNDEEKMIYCINKLRSIPITFSYLQETGVGKTVNSVRRLGGEVGKLAKDVVSEWKEAIDFNERAKQQPEDSGNEEGYESETNESPKYKEREHSHRHEDHSRDDHKKHSKSSSSSHRDSSKNLKDSDEKSKHSKESRSDHKSKHKDKDHRSSEKENKEKSKKDKKEEVEVVEKNNLSSSSKKSHGKDKEHHRHSSSKETRHDKTSRDSDDHKKNPKSSSEEKHKSSSKHKTSKETKLEENSSSKEQKKRSHSEIGDESKDKNSKKIKHNKNSSSKHFNDGIDCGSGTSFAEALGMLEPSSSSRTKKREKVVESSPKNSRSEVSPVPSKMSKHSDESLSPSSSNKKVDDFSKTPPLLVNPKLEPLDINISNLLPEITPNYRPLGMNYCDSQNLKLKRISDDEALSAGITSKTQRTKVYSGNKTNWGKVSSLFDMCIRVLQDNIDALEYTGGVPYSILKPVLDRCTPDQLFTMEHHNPYLIEDTDELWKFHCQKEFRTKKREELETWRDMYMRCLDEREAKLKALTSNIKLSQEKSLPVRQTKLAYVDSVAKPPRNVARKQAKNGIDNKPAVTPSARLSALATAGEAGKVSVPNPGPKAVTSSNSERGSSSSHSAAIKPKKAPLMQKALALIKNRFRR